MHFPVEAVGFWDFVSACLQRLGVDKVQAVETSSSSHDEKLD